MIRVRIFSLVLAVFCLSGLALGAAAAQVDCDAVYCFTGQDFSEDAATLSGICVTGLPEASSGTVLLGNRVIRPGDILTTAQLQQLTFHPLRTREDTQAVLSYLPIYPDRVEPTAIMTIGIRGKEDKAPVAQDSAMETYKNLSNDGSLNASDPEGEALVYTLVRGPKRGDVELRPDGTFTYTPKRNKVGVDSFIYTATDPAGNVSRQATVTVQILKPTDAKGYVDTADSDCRFEAEWLRSSGLFIGEQIGNSACFQPEKAVSRGEFLTMLVKILNLPVEETETVQLPVTAPAWLRPYLAAAQRSGLTDQLEQTLYTDPIHGQEAAIMVQNALDLAVTTQVLEQTQLPEDISAHAAASLAVLAENGVLLEADAPLTRAAAAKALYRVSQLATDAPGTAVFRTQ